LDKEFTTKPLLFLLLVSLILTGAAAACRREQRPAQQEKKESIPAPLTSIVDNSQGVIEQMERLQQEMEKPAGQQGGETDGGEGENQQGGQGNGGGQGEGQGGGQSPPNPEQEKKQKIDKIWEEALKIVEDTHRQWNDYESTAVRDKARDYTITEFERFLNGLTVAVNRQDIDAAMEQANGMCLAAADFLDLYKNNPDGQITKVRYYLQQSCIDAGQDDWAGARQSVTVGKREAEELGREVELEEADRGLIEKLNLSIDNMEVAMANRDLDLLKIKKDIALENLDKVKEKAK